MIEHISSFFSVLKQSSPVFLLGISIACGALVFLPENIVSVIGLNDFRALQQNLWVTIGWGRLPSV